MNKKMIQIAGLAGLMAVLRRSDSSRWFNGERGDDTGRESGRRA
jgi:hypothetical protein